MGLYRIAFDACGRAWQFKTGNDPWAGYKHYLGDRIEGVEDGDYQALSDGDGVVEEGIVRVCDGRLVEVGQRILLSGPAGTW
jgi:hypothetical protein